MLIYILILHLKNQEIWGVQTSTDNCGQKELVCQDARTEWRHSGLWQLGGTAGETDNPQSVWADKAPPSSEDGKTATPGFAHFLLVPLLMSLWTSLSFKLLLILFFQIPCPRYIPHPFNILFIPVFLLNAACSWQSRVCTPGRSSAVSGTSQRFINVSSFLKHKNNLVG